MINNLKEEKMQILKMVEEGKINVEEGVNLLDALEESKDIDTMKNNAQWLKIKVYDSEDDTKVNVNIPIALINLGMKISPKFVPELKDANLNENDFKEILDAIENGAHGKIVDIESDNGEKVEIIVE